MNIDENIVVTATPDISGRLRSTSVREATKRTRCIFEGVEQLRWKKLFAICIHNPHTMKSYLEVAKRHAEDSSKTWRKVLWSDEIKMYNVNVPPVHRPKITISAVKHGGNIMLAIILSLLFASLTKALITYTFCWFFFLH